MSTKKLGATGPTTPGGKATSSQNARKASIFAKGYLPWENPDEKQAQMEALSDQWQAYDATRQIILRTIEQANLGLERMMYAERMVLEGAMQSAGISKQFIAQAGWECKSPDLLVNLPSWYFINGEREKEQSNYFAEIFDQAKELKNKYSDQLVAQVEGLFPLLFAYVMRGRQGSFLTALGQAYKQTTPQMNLTVMMNKLNEQFPYHLWWAEAPARHQAIVDGLRGQQMLQVVDWDKSNKYATSFQNRIMKGFAAMQAMQHLEDTSQGLAPIQLAPDESLLKQLDVHVEEADAVEK